MKNSSRTRSGVDSLVMCAASLLFLVEGPKKGVHYMLFGFLGQYPLRGLWLLTCHITNILLIFRAPSRKIWAWRLWNGRLSRRWVWLLFILHVFRCIMLLLLTVQNHYDFSYLVLRQKTSPFHMQNLTKLHAEENCRAATTSNSKLSTERNRTSARYYGGKFSFPHLGTITQLAVSNTIRF